MACKKRTTVMERLESPDCALFKFPGELRNAIYDLVFENGNETMSVADFASAPVKLDWHVDTSRSRPVKHVGAVPANAGPPSSALVRTCQKIHEETEGIFAAAYHRFWQKSFIFDLRGVSLLDRYMDCVPTAWTRSYTLVFDIGPESPPGEVILSRSGGKWQASAKSKDICEGDPQSLSSMLAKDVLDTALMILQRWNDAHMLYVKPKKWRKMSDKTRMKKRANKEFSRKDNKLKTKSERVQSKAFKTGRTVPGIASMSMDLLALQIPRPGPINMIKLFIILHGRMGFSLLVQSIQFAHTASEAELKSPYTNDQLSRWMSHEVGV